MSTPEPYVGPRPFDRKDCKFFFGRDHEADDLLSLVLAHPVVLIYAASGAGKSSLLNAGLIPRLTDEDFQILGPARVTGPFPHETGKVTNIYRFHALSKFNSDLSASVATESELAWLSLTDFLQRLDEREPGRSRALIFDQFEEFFSANVAQNEQRRAFIEELAQSLGAAPRLKVVFGMREEYVTQFEPFAYILPDRLRTRMRLEPLRARAAVEAIRQPLKALDLSFEEGADDPAEALVRELLKISVITGPGQVREITGEFVEPLQLQVVCQNMWRNFPEELKAYATEPQGLPRERKIITRDQIRTGDVDQALAQHYDRAIEDAARVSGTSQRQLRRWFGWTLITAAGMRGIALASSEETAQLPETALDVFLDQRLVRKESRGGSEWYELTHDRFIEPIQRSNRAWFEKRPESEALLSKLESTAGKAGVLLDEKETREAEAFLASPDARVLGPSPQVESLVRASRLRVDKEAGQRRMKLTLAWSAIALLLVALLVSIYGFVRVSSEKNKAIEQKRIAKEETLRARKQNFEYMSAIEDMANRLVELSTPQEALSWHQRRATALSLRNMHNEAIEEYDSVLQLDPENGEAKFGRGYEYYTQGRAEEALRDTESYLAKASHSWNAHQNRGLCLSSLGQYAEAEKAIRDSIREFQFTGTEQMESEVAPGIQAATGRTILRGDEKLWQTANYYQLANLKAYAGSEDFDGVLTEAGEHANSADAALIALNWAWLHMKKRKEDYGALVARGALWERAGFKERAKKKYQRFERIHKQTKDKRYQGLAHWASRRLARLKRVGSPPDEEASVDMLVLETNELVAKGELKEALTRIDKAIDKDSDNAMLHLTRASIFYGQKEYHACSLDCSLVLLKQPNTSLAYFWRGVANMKMNEDPKKVEADLRNALEYDPDDGEIMVVLSDALFDRARKEGFATSGHQLDEALQLLGRSTSSGVSFRELPNIYRKIAQVHCARGNFNEAIKSLDTAIAIIANSGKALDFCWQGLEVLTGDEKQIYDAEVEQEIAATMATISQIIERAGSRAKATEFWQSIASSERMKLLRDGAKTELDRLAKAR